MCVSPTLAHCNQLHVVSSTDSEIIVELTTDDYSIERVVHGGEEYASLYVRGYGQTDETGLPRLPIRGGLLGVPFGTGVGMEIVSVESEVLGAHRVEPAATRSVVRDTLFIIPVEEHVPDAGFYARGATYPVSVAELGFDSTLRHQRVVQILFHPFQYNPQTSQLTLNKRIVVRVRLSGTRRPTDRMPVTVEEREWESLYGGTVLNYREAKAWRMRPEPRRASLRADFRQDHEAYRFSVDESGVYKLTYQALANAGLDRLLSVDEIGVYERSFDDEETDPFISTPAPIIVSDVNANGLFDGSDHILFFGRSFEQRLMPVGYEDRYTDKNVYWFGWGEGVAERMPERPGWHDQTGLSSPSAFRDTLRFEEDVYFDRTPPSGVVDMWHWSSYFDIQNPGQDRDDFLFPFTIHDIHGDGDIRLRARYQGIKSGNHQFDFWVIDGASQQNSLGTFQFSGYATTMDRHFYDSPSDIPASYFTEGENTLRSRGYGSPYATTSGANLDWFEFAYQREFVARSGKLVFTNAQEMGIAEFEVDGFESEDIRLFDVTDPLSPVAITLDSQNVQPSGGGYSLVFQDSVASFTRYESVEEGDYLSPATIERREAPTLVTDEADYIVISYEGFADGIEPLIAKREAQGWITAHTSVNDVYDQFSGGVPSPHAIKNYLRYAYEEWTRQPQFLLLVGDASEDPRGLHHWSNPNYMPTYLYAGSSNSDIRTSDEWYVCLLDEDPYLPQMYVGRLPVGNISELETAVNRLLTYENYSPNDEWRNEVLLVADDAWKYYTGNDYCRYIGEDEFSQVTVRMAEAIADSPAEVDTTLFLLKRYTEPFHGDLSCDDLWATFDFVGTDVTPHLLEELSEGAVIFNFQGHANRKLITHEALLVDQTQDPNDFGSIDNKGKPFIFLGFACALSEFASYTESHSSDCFTEQLLFLSGGAGAVATFASTGIEWLDPNAVYNEKLYEAFFEPNSEEEEYFWPRWSLGGILGKATVKLIESTSWTSPARSFILFGDPLMHVETTPPSMRVTIDGSPFFSGDYLDAAMYEPGETVQIVADIIDEVEINRSSVSVYESDVGTISPDDYTIEALMDTVTQAEQSRWYRITYDAPVREHNYDMTISAADVNGQQVSFVLHVATDRGLEIEYVANHPNPFTGATTVIYFLTQGDADVKLRIYTVGGRLIRVVDDAPNDLNYNEWEWDGRDEQGDEVANGVYLLSVEAKGADGKVARPDPELWKMLRAR